MKGHPFQKYCFISTLIITLFLSGCALSEISNETPGVQKGVLNLSRWDFSQEGVISPKGEWKAYLQKFIAGQGSDQSTLIPTDAYIPVPGTWSKSKDLNGKPIPAYTYLTLHLKISGIKRNKPGESLVIYFPHIRSASELYIQSENDITRLAASNGQIGTSKETYRPWLGSLEGEFGATPSADIFLQISNFDDATVQGVREQFYIGTRDQIDKLKSVRRHSDFLVMGMILFAGLFMLVFFPLRRSEFAPLWLGLFSLTFVIRVYVLRLYAFEYFENLYLFNTFFRWNYFTVYFLTLSYTAFMRSVFPAQFSRRVSIPIYVVCILYAITVQVTSPAFFSQLFHPFIYFLILALFWVGYGQIKATFERQDVLSYLTLAGSLCLIIATLIETVFSILGLQFHNFLQIGISLNILCMSLVVSIHNARERNRVEKLTRQLSQEVEIRSNAEKEISLLYQQLANRMMDTSVKLKSMEQELSSTEHKTEMAAITTDTLHNVKNVLSSLKTSTEMVYGSLKDDFYSGFEKATNMLTEKLSSYREQLTDDPKDYKLLEYILKLRDYLADDIEFKKQQLSRAMRKIDAIEDIITSQQKYGGEDRLESVDPIMVMEDALTMQMGSLTKSRVHVETSFDEPVLIQGEKIKLLHVFINIIKNAIEAMSSLPREEKVLLITSQNIDEKIQIVLKDRGQGIKTEDLPKVFTRGFTTKAQGHGFGLNSSYNYINEMGGDIACQSEGPGQGASFIIEFPISGD